MRRRFAILALSIAFTAPVAAAPSARPAEGRTRVRSVEVTEAGWILLPFDGDLLLRGGLTNPVIYDGTGQTLSSALLSAPSGEIEPRSVSLQEHSKGWRLLLDLGVAPLMHDRISLRASDDLIAPGVAIEVSDDGVHFNPLVRGDLFWLGGTSHLQRGWLDYPPSRGRFLAVEWPKRAGLPQLAALRVRTLGDAPFAAVDAVLGPLPGGGLPAQQRLFDVPAAVGPLIREAISEPAVAEDEPTLLLGTQNRFWVEIARWNGPRLESPACAALTGTVRMVGRAGRAIDALTLRLSPRWLVFEAPRAGRYFVAYGGSALLSTGEIGDPLGKIARVVLPGPVTSGTLQLPPVALFAPGPQAKPGAGGTRWPNYPSDVVHRPVLIPLPEEVITKVGGRIEGLRLTVGGRLLPFAPIRGAAPAVALTLRGREALDFALPASPSATVQLEIDGFDPGTTLQAITAVVSGDPPLRPTVRVRRPTDRADAPLLVFLSIARHPEPQRVTLQGIPESQLDRITVRLWREEVALLTIGPPGEPMALSSGFPPQADPYPDFSRYAALLLAQEPTTVGLDLAHATPVDTGPNRWRPLLLVAEGMAALALLLILWRSTRKPR